MVSLICVVLLTHCSQGLADNCVISKVNGEVWDLDRPLETDCELRLVKFDDPDGLLQFSCFRTLFLNIGLLAI